MTSGIYRRRIRTATGAGFARADLEDDPHRFGLLLQHDGTQVTGATGEPRRTPWSRCGEAAAMLQRLAGMRLDPDPLAVQRHTSMQQQCTHLFDLAGLAVAHAARSIAARQYDAEVTVPESGTPRHARLRRDGAPVLEWMVEGPLITAGDFEGGDLRRILAADMVQDSPDLFEAVMVLRRAVHISDSRLLQLDSLPGAGALTRYTGACYVFQPERAGSAARNVGTLLDFTDRPEALLADLDKQENAPPE